ncbi:hypothetical protein TPHA_0I02630 [Tetrapisispora phaffii CBS 4417]|uniref:Mitochondrial import inner membrane translocase subunit TIM54 n=1 Tax=Tetrapisispora phaffii (strain ATCC 24235 / CBS 4417 / NBRC 1672 / NRRL Y-8282 / UCD 70-5) TaxID=1071381 RepID=G8BXY6_TETPH|nr:hypothetical protein TPHA_0I02630 [Tetrapisispora phaffii CBS 4417]CCE64764.1 hypothetical protein TPHA_0I02630 [Tetrapisispora phaffii CBS 4417]
MSKPPNPALKAMGLSWIKLPSRNWIIFGTVFGGLVSGVLYDKDIQKKIRLKYINEVKSNSNTKISTVEVPRKITVFIAPPPSDYLDVSMKIWRRYVKPILYYSGYEYELIEENRQGLIRTEVANRIRAVRRELKQQLEDKNTKSELRIETAKNGNGESEDDNGKEFKRNFDYRDIMGIFYKSEKPKEIISEDSQTLLPELAGGVICIGRGSYKEYINGIHEGMLGPLEALSEPTIAEINNEPASEPQGNTSIDNDSTNVDINIATSSTELNPTLNKVSDTDKDSENEDDEDDDEKRETRKLKPYLTSDQYSTVDIPLEISQALLKGNDIIRDPQNKIPIMLHQPVLVIPVPNLIGFLAIPERIYRFYTKRKYVEEVCSEVASLVNQKNIRPYESSADLSLAAQEESDWPSKWVKQGLERKSEWTQELKDDPRVTKYMHICASPPQEQDK